MDIKGRVVVVTGGASGIGAALARRFAAEGALGVVVADLDEAGATAVAREISGLAVRADVSVESEVQGLVARASERYGRVDVMCSNAGVYADGGLERPNAEWQRMWDVHVMAHIYAARAVLPQMLARREGYLVQMASAAGLLSHPESAAYAVSKHATVALAEWIAFSYGERGVRVSCVCPKGVRTPMLMGERGDIESVLQTDMLSPEEVASDVVGAMRAERFLVLPHGEVLEHVRGRATDIEQYLAAMQAWRKQG